MTAKLKLEILPGDSLTNDNRDAILPPSTRNPRDYERFLQAFDGFIHILGRIDGKITSHVLWITRWLQAGELPLLRTAYLEAVSAEETYQGQGFATMVMQRLGNLFPKANVGRRSVR